LGLFRVLRLEKYLCDAVIGNGITFGSKMDATFTRVLFNFKEVPVVVYLTLFH